MISFKPLLLTAALLLAANTQAQTLLGGGKTAPSFPITINQSGSYKLAGNLNVPAGLDGIVIASGVNVTLDLGGYQISGPISCSKSGCNSNTQTTGIKIADANARIFGGAIKGFGLYGIGIQNGTVNRLVLEDLQVSGNLNGIFAIAAVVTRTVAENNAYWGISLNRGVVTESMAYRNGGSGIGMSVGTVRNSTSLENGKFGFEISAGMYDGLTSAQNAMGNSLAGAAGPNGLY